MTPWMRFMCIWLGLGTVGAAIVSAFDEKKVLNIPNYVIISLWGPCLLVFILLSWLFRGLWRNHT